MTTTTTPETFGQRLRRLRTSKGMTQKDLGSRAGTTFSYIAHIEADRRRPGASLTERLRRVLGVAECDFPMPWVGKAVTAWEMRLLQSYRRIRSPEVQATVRRLINELSLYGDGADGEASA